MYADDIRHEAEIKRIDSLGNAFSSVVLQKPSLSSERAETNLAIYEIYTSSVQTKLRKIENWKRYVTWLKEHRYKDSQDTQKQFQKNKMFIKTHSKSSIAFLTSHLKLHDLKYVLSVGKDMDKRGENFSAWLLAKNKSVI